MPLRHRHRLGRHGQLMVKGLRRLDRKRKTAGRSLVAEEEAGPTAEGDPRFVLHGWFDGPGEPAVYTGSGAGSISCN
jgi:hypothetical protein